jgi:ATP-binding cassette subfamily B protein
MQRVWKKLTEGEAVPSSRWFAMGLGTISAFLMPVLLTLIGWFVQLLFVVQTTENGKRVLPETLYVGSWLRITTSSLSTDKNILRCAITLLMLITVVFVIERLTLLLARRASLQAALQWTSRLLRRLFHQSRNLSVDQGLSGQRKRLRDLIQSDVPRVRDALTEWYRVIPRNLIQTIAVLVLASLIHPWLTLLAILALVVTWGLFITLEAAQRKHRPVILERRRNAHEQLIYLCESSAMLESVDPRVDVEHMYDTHAQHFNHSQLRLADESAFRSPSLLITITLLTALFLFVLSIRVLEPESTLHIGDIVVLSGCVIVAVNGIFRLRRGLRKRSNAITSADNLENYLSIQGVRTDSLGKGIQARITSSIEFEHVCFRDSSKNRILDDVSLSLIPKQITAIVSLEPATADALGEMVLGFGLPTSGRALVDGINLIDLDPMSVRRQSLLVNEHGPLLDGTVEENLWSGRPKDAMIDVMDLARNACVSESILNLPDGLGTVLSSNDDRLAPDQLYRFGIVRALLKKPSVIVCHEPRMRVSAKDEAESLQALQQLRGLNAIVLVLPERLSTLRAADQILVFRHGKLVSSGTHQQLLEQSEIYRHFNYMRFAVSE